MKLTRDKLQKIIKVIIMGIFISSAVFIGGCDDRSDPAPGPMINGEPGYDVIVVGGEPEGIAAALSAARNGLKTLLIEDDAALGGLMTLGKLNFLDMNHGPKKELLTRGIFQEFYKELGNAFDVEEAKTWFLNRVKSEENITLLLNTKVLEPIMEDTKITGVRVQTGAGSKDYYSLRVIDATVDADIAAQAGVPYTVGGEDYGEKNLLMGVTLVFEISGVDWERVVKYLKYEDNDPNSGADKVAAWGYGKEAMEYQPQDKMMRFRGPNLARQKNGNVLVNALLIFGVNGLDPLSRAEGIARGKQETPHIVAFMREKFPGFAQAEFVGTAEQLYVRETRHIQGEYRLTITDVLENRDHWDKIGLGSYPVDVQPTSPQNFGNIIGIPDLYGIPFRCLVPQKVDNLLVVGRSASYDSLPHGSARVIPVGMVTGEAAGAACAYSIKEDLSFREMTKTKAAIAWVQKKLKKQGAYLVNYTPPRPTVMDHWAYPGVKVTRELGLIEGGYDNNYRLERKICQASLQNKLNKVIRVAHEKNSRVVLRWVEIPETVNRQAMIIAVAEALTGEKMSYEQVWVLLKEKQILTADLEQHINWKENPDFAEMLTILANLYEYLLKI